MKTCFFALSASVASLALAAGSPAPAFPPHVIGNSQLRVLATAANGRTYQLHVHLPGSYAKETSRRYPVLYVTDGYWDFATIVTSYDNLVYDRVVPELIIVGLGYAGDDLDYNKLRNWELSPVRTSAFASDTGHAAEFLAMLERDFVPFIEREYRADPKHRALAGSSLGGLFALYAMLSKPELFDGYIAASPAVRVGNDWLLGREADFAKTGRALPARLFMTGAEKEDAGFLASIKRFHAQLVAHRYKGFELGWRIIDGERHAGTKAESYVRGMRFIYAPLAPVSAPGAD